MERLLAIDASAEACSAALYCEGRYLHRASSEARSHAQKLLGMVDELLAEAQLPLAELDALVLSRGPGSFTGLRIATAVVQGLAYGANLPVYAISSLAALAEEASLHLPTESATVLAALDARMGEVYWQCFALEQGQLRPLSAAGLCAAEQLAAEVSAYCAAGAVFAVGSGAAALPSPLAQLSLPKLQPSAAALIRLLKKDCQHAVLYPLAQDIELLYLRNDVAWQKRTRIRTSN